MASDLLRAAGFQDEALAIALAVSYVEADGPAATKRFGKLCAYGDAVGDIQYAILGPYADQASATADVAARKAAGKAYPNPVAYVQRADGWYAVNTKWGKSLSLFQVRTLLHPEEYPYPDTLRVAEDVRFPDKNAVAAFAISNKGTVWTKWSTFVHGTYKPYLIEGFDYEVVLGHPDADKWSAQ